MRSVVTAYLVYCPLLPFTCYLRNYLSWFLDTSVKSASYQPILRNGDFKFSLGKPVEVGSEKINDEFIEVSYKLRNGRVAKDYLYQVLRHDHLVNRKPEKKPGIPLNILVLGLDSLSQGNAHRSLGELYEYITTELGAVTFKGLSIVGDGTTPQLTAFLTGKHVEEQYEARTGASGAKPLDGWTWIFKDLKDHGYLTGFSEDGVWDGPFQYRLKGFNVPPTDFYPRAYFLNVGQKTRKIQQPCIGNRNIGKIHIDYVKAVFDAYPEKLKFFMSFNAGFSHHDMNAVRKNEADLLSLLKHLQTKGHLENTLVIVMGDHGLRWGAVRTLVQGKLEERLPLFSMIFPNWFKEKHANLMKIVQTNSNRFISWFDVYATLRHILSYPDLPGDLTHGQSLFQEVPANRTCEAAAVPKHWCPCLEWATVDTAHSHINMSAMAAVEFMNHFINQSETSKKACTPLSLKTINFAQLERPNSVLSSLFNKQNTQKQGREYFCRYQIQFVTSPNEGIYEATVKYHNGRLLVAPDISRINLYGDQPRCVADKLPYVRKYCLCKDYKGKL